jgi:ribulose-phosphate 3-epimerase
VIDGHFVPRLTFGVPWSRDRTDRPSDRDHLMVERPEGWVPDATRAPTWWCSTEATHDPLDVVERIRAERRAAGVAVRHDTPLADLTDELLGAVDLVNLVAVPLGFGGSASADDTFERIAALRARLDGAGLRTGIEVDGGVKPSTAARYAGAGADMLTVGTGIYHAPDVAEAVKTLRASTAADDTARERLERFLSVPSSSPVDDAARRARLDALRADLDIPKRVWDPLTSAR